MFLFLVLILPSKCIEMFSVPCCNRLESFYSRSRDIHQRYMLAVYDKDSETRICFSGIYSMDMCLSV